MERLMKFKQSQRGFTFMEIMIVMVLLGILVTMVTGSFTSSSRRGRDNRRKSDLHNIQTALEAYMSDKGVYPESSVDGEIVGCGFSGSEICGWGMAFVDQNDTVYMVKLPDDPVSAQRYYYVSTPTSYYLYAKLENIHDDGDGVNQSGYSGIICNTDGVTECTYGISSTNVSP